VTQRAVQRLFVPPEPPRRLRGHHPPISEVERFSLPLSLSSLRRANDFFIFICRVRISGIISNGARSFPRKLAVVVTRKLPLYLFKVRRLGGRFRRSTGTRLQNARTVRPREDCKVVITTCRYGRNEIPSSNETPAGCNVAPRTKQRRATGSKGFPGTPAVLRGVTASATGEGGKITARSYNVHFF